MADSISISSINELSSFHDINGIKTRLWERGEGAPLVLIHGFMGTLCDWRLNIFDLARHFSVKAFDLPGFGYSDKPGDFPYTADGYACFLIALLDKLNIKKATLVGNSLGGQIALGVCLKYPDRVSSLILVDSGGYPGSVKFPLFRLLKIPALGEALMSLASPVSVRYVLSHVLKDKSSITDDVVSYYYNVFSTANARKVPPVVIRNMVIDEIQIPGRLKEINCPVLIIWGAQ
ncbi:MAG: alpha/beta fold hydrolase, partial [Chloroflexi bacterium]|nr:alpha/beta fold hydrolase [Chloroflexota bacterium]